MAGNLLGKVGLWVAALAGADGVPPGWKDTVSRTRELARQDVIMPVEEIRLGAELAQLVTTPSDVERVRVDLLGDANFHVRRVGLKALRLAADRQPSAVTPILLHHLKDPAGWNRYEAAWGLETAGVRNNEILRALEMLAGDVAADAGHQGRDSDADHRAQLRAAQALQVLRKPAAPRLRRHKETSLGLELLLPEEWPVTPDPILPLTAVSPRSPALSIKVAHIHPGREVQPRDVVEASVKQYARTWTVEQRKPLGKDGEELLILQTLGNSSTRVLKLFIPRSPQEVLIVSCSAPAGDFETWKPAFEQVAASVRVSP
jgi:hypothetical protein